MPTGFAAHWGRRAIVWIAAWLVVLQAFFAGVAIAQTGATIAFDPVAAAAICHGSGVAGSDDTTAPETGKVRHLCCAYCMSAAPAVPPPAALNVLQPRPISRLIAHSGFTLVLAHQAVRAGRSQAPPEPA
jgi:Protein of unknown function (DUF2946)